MASRGVRAAEMSWLDLAPGYGLQLPPTTDVVVANRTGLMSNHRLSDCRHEGG